MLSRPESLNAAQIQMVQQAVRELADNMKLRQWCVEKALAAGSNNPVKLAAEIFEFIVPATSQAEEMER